MANMPTYEELEQEIRSLKKKISERKKIEAALGETEERLELVLDATSEGIWDWDIVNGKTYASARCNEIFGVHSDQGIPNVSESWSSRIHPDDYDLVSQSLKNHLKKKTPFNVTYRHRHEDGEYRWQSARGMALFSNDGNAYRMVGSIRDITENKRIEQEKARLEADLQQAQKIEALGTLANGIAHDFNNLLTAIMGNIELSQMHAKGNEKTQKNLLKAKAACKRARDLTRQVITFAKGLDPNLQTDSLAKTIESSATLALTNKNTRCEFSLSEDLWPVDFDIEQIRLVFTNLVTNASEAMDEKGIIHISAVNVDSENKNALEGLINKHIRISIQDYGKGIDKESQIRIFDPYYSSKKTATQKGLGLGLSICYSIIDKHGGRIEVESEVNQGTTFHIYLPISKKRLRKNDCI